MLVSSGRGIQSGTDIPHSKETSRTPKKSGSCLTLTRLSCSVMSHYSPHRLGCCRTDHPDVGRRELLQIGSLSLLGTGLADLLRLEAHAEPTARPKARAKSVVFIFQSGGPSQHETFDLKPDAPVEMRGPFHPISTNVPGIHYFGSFIKLYRPSEILPPLSTVWIPASNIHY